MANLRLTNALANAEAQKVIDLIDAGATGGLIKIYTATQPATADTAVTSQTLLVTLTFSATSASAPSAGVITFSSITSGTAVATGTAAWARITDSTGTAVFDCDVSTSGATINLSSVSINTSDSVSITSFTYTVPKS